MKFLCLPTITTSDNLWRWKVLVSDKSARPSSSLVTTSESINIRARLTGPLMPYLDTPSKVSKKTRPFTQRTLRSWTVCSPRWPEYLAFWLTRTNSPLSIKSSYAEQLFFPGWTSSGTHSEPNWTRKGLTKPALVLYIWHLRSYKK